jgi:hypothetical protein
MDTTQTAQCRAQAEIAAQFTVKAFIKLSRTSPKILKLPSKVGRPHLTRGQLSAVRVNGSL